MVSHTKEEANSESCLSELRDYNVHASQDGAAHRTASTLRLGSRMSGMEMHWAQCSWLKKACHSMSLMSLESHSERRKHKTGICVLPSVSRYRNERDAHIYLDDSRFPE